MPNNTRQPTGADLNGFQGRASVLALGPRVKALPNPSIL
jgi:hypothetical protein